MFPPDLDVPTAYWFYRKYLLDAAQDKLEIYQRYGFLAPPVASVDWEVFIAILVRDRRKPGDGADLERHEVKSAGMGGAFEYQYHREYGMDKLEEDKTVDHVFISYGSGYKDVDVRIVEKTKLTMVFESWKPELEANYKIPNRQRFRKSVASGFVRMQGELLLTIRDGELVYPTQLGGSILALPPTQ